MTAAAEDTPDKDPSMDDILASIRRIMLDEQARLQDGPAAQPAAQPALSNRVLNGRGDGSGIAEASPGAEADPVLILDSSMVVEDGSDRGLATPYRDTPVIIPPIQHPTEPPPVRSIEPFAEAPIGRGMASLPETAPQIAPEALPEGASVMADQGPRITMSAEAIEALMAPAAAAAAAASVDALIKRLSEERLATLQAPSLSSPSIEDVVRSELRPYLKAWLDEHMPPMVERLVRVEITRLMGRSGF